MLGLKLHHSSLKFGSLFPSQILNLQFLSLTFHMNQLFKDHVHLTWPIIWGIRKEKHNILKSMAKIFIIEKF